MSGRGAHDWLASSGHDDFVGSCGGRIGVGAVAVTAVAVTTVAVTSVAVRATVSAVDGCVLGEVDEGDEGGKGGEADADPERAGHRADERVAGGVGDLGSAGAEAVADLEGGADVVEDCSLQVGRHAFDAVELPSGSRRRCWRRRCR